MWYDKHAKAALLAYAQSAALGYPLLSADLRALAESKEGRG